jgi:hypothetical protein
MSGVHLGTVIGEVWKKGASAENSMRTLKATGIFSLHLNGILDNCCSVFGAVETGEESEFAASESSNNNS